MTSESTTPEPYGGACVGLFRCIHRERCPGYGPDGMLFSPAEVEAFLAGPEDRLTIDDLRARLAATEIKLAAARLALAACREVREGREA